MSRAEQALALYRRATPYPGDALDRHCLRLAHLTLLLGQRHGVPLDEDLVRAAAWLHDIGLMVRDPATRSYLRRGLDHVRPLADSWAVDAEARRGFDETMLYNHSLRAIPGLHPAAEMFRRAVHVEHSLGASAQGLDRAAIRETFRRWPRRGLTRILVDFARVTVRQDGPGEVVRIFLPIRPEAA